jgi:ATP-dependent Clp protease adapter protein ClpS
MEERVLQLDLQSQLAVNSFGGEETILLRYDDCTPDYHYMYQLQSVFELSDELAEHIILVAREAGAAYVVTRPRQEAERLINDARATAQMFGLPSFLGLEQELCRCEKDSQNATLKSIMSSLVLCFMWFFMLCLSVLRAS